MEFIDSADGTPIAYDAVGSGRPLVFVHGTSADHASWDGLRPRLEEGATVYAVERRGRGESGDGPAYDPAREFEDVVAVVESVGEPVVLVGHSFGALCSLEAALRTEDLRGLVLYEPPIGDAAPGYYSEAVCEEMEALLAEEENERALLCYLREIIGLPEPALEGLQGDSMWPSRVAAAEVLPREYRGAAEYTFDAARFDAMDVPTLLITGVSTYPWAEEATATLERALPDSPVARIEGHGHIAYATAPDRFVKELLGFVNGLD
jgi:pimeloyl-ACP methyl ester carboxylesterase